MQQGSFPWVGLTVAAVSVVVVTFAMSANVPNFSLLTILVLVGLVAITGFVSVLSMTASRLGILDSRQPFGLPEGSIRAILTLAFIVLVGVFASYLLAQTSRTAFVETSAPMRLPVTTMAEAKAMQDSVGTSGLVVVRGDGTPASPYGFFLVPRADYTVANDVAKQILTMLSTMLAAMIGFYFGARPNETPVDPFAAEREAAKAELAGLALKAPTFDQVKKAADEKSETNLSAEQKAKLKEIRERIALVGKKIDAAREAAKDQRTPVETLRNTKTAALEAHGTLAAELEALQALP
ncbi:hypothetical protein [Phreatobacter oligotrophus]|uniref:Uncharacterized protein n=1 Tax=Phreatobacter oligotrophus TaxID=1122261 RepID=A0A2T4YZJ9_9HYPH|nr:hypothetical protein [Phreatobacter oligotrophus]PTM52360.1 hypothetical protein C8P69_108161 [Phreatobacter oligotrophus]